MALSPKATEVLTLLIESHGNLVERKEILEKVWCDTYVEEGVINNAISALRKRLGGAEIIQTVPRRGYRFTAEVQEIFNEDDETELIIEKYTISQTLFEEIEGEAPTSSENNFDEVGAADNISAPQ